MKVSHIFPMLGLALFCQCHEATAEGVPTTPQSPTETTDSATADASTKPLPKDATPTVYAGYRLIWNDEFNADGRPSDQWTYEQGFVRNHELQWYQPDNASVSNGVLVIEGRQQKVSNPDYDPQSTDWHYARPEAQFTSSCLTTQKSFHFRYGRMEVRARIPVTRGAWPAIWTLGNQGEWPQNGEIDLMEFYLKNGAPSIQANACWGSDKRYTAVWDDTATPFTHFTANDAAWASKFHVWRMDWDEHFIRLYLDGELLNEVDLSKTRNQGVDGDYDNPFSNTREGFGQYILLNLAIGSNGGEPDLKHFPLRYEIDYVRVYQAQP